MPFLPTVRVVEHGPCLKTFGLKVRPRITFFEGAGRLLEVVTRNGRFVIEDAISRGGGRVPPGILALSSAWARQRECPRIFGTKWRASVSKRFGRTWFTAKSPPHSVLRMNSAMNPHEARPPVHLIIRRRVERHRNRVSPRNSLAQPGKRCWRPRQRISSECAAALEEGGPNAENSTLIMFARNPAYRIPNKTPLFSAKTGAQTQFFQRDDSKIIKSLSR